MPDERQGGAQRTWEPEPQEVQRLARVLQDSLDTLELAAGGGIVASGDDVDAAGAKGVTVVKAESAAWAARNGLEAYRQLIAMGVASPNPDVEKYLAGADEALWKYADIPLENVYPEMLILDWYGLKALSALAGVASAFLGGITARFVAKVGLKAALPRVAGVVVGGGKLVGGLGTISGVPAVLSPLGVSIPGIGWLAPLPMTGLVALQSAFGKKEFAEEFTSHLVALFGPGGEGVRAPESSSRDILARMHLSSGNAVVDFMPELAVDLVIMALVGGASQAGKRLAPRIEAKMSRLPVALQNTVRELAARMETNLTPRQRALVRNAGQVPIPRPKVTPTEAKPLARETPVLQGIYRKFWGKAEVQRRGKISDAEARDLAARLGVTAEDLAKIAAGTPANVEKMLGTMDVVKRDTSSLINYVQNEALSAEAKRLEVIRHAKSVMALLGQAAEAGRALRILRYQDPLVRVIRDMGDEVRDWKEPPDKVIDNVVKLIEGMDPNDPWDSIAVHNLLRMSGQQKFWDKLYFVWLNFILSNPTTHVVNVTSNSLTQLASVPESELASVIAKFRGKGKQQLGEGVAQLIGFKRAVRDTFTNINRIPTELQGMGKIEEKGGTTLPLGAERVVGIPTQALSKEDLIAKSVVYYGEIYRLAWRQAQKEGLTGRAFVDRVEQLYTDPTADMIKAGTVAAFDRTFNTELEGVMKKVMELRNAMPGARWILPFVRTPYNIAVYGLKRTPLGLTQLVTMARERAKMRDTGTWSQSRESAYQTKINEVLAQGIVGTMAQLLVFWAVQNGNITGSGPTDQNERQALERQGWQRYSFRIGNRYYSYFRLEPMATVLGLAADAGELTDAMTEDEKLKVWTKIFGSFRNNLTNKTFLSGLIDFSAVLSDPDRYGARWAQRWAGSVIPGAVVNIRTTTDPNEREARTILDTIRNRVPGLAKALPQRLNVWGEPIVHPESWYVRMISPVAYTEAKPDPVEDELKKIGYAVGMPSDKLGDRKMTAEEYERFLRMSGPVMKTALIVLFASPKYRDMSIEQKRRAVRKVIDDTRDAARDAMLGVLPKLPKTGKTGLSQYASSVLGKQKPSLPEPEHPVMPGYK